MLALLHIQLQIRNLKTHCFVRLRCHEHVLVFRIRFLNSLLEARHDSKLWLATFWQYFFWKFQLKQYRLLSCVRISLLDDSVAWLANPFNFLGELRLVYGLDLIGVLFSLLTLLEIGLMLFALGMDQIWVFRRVQRQAQTTLKGTQVIAQDVRVILELVWCLTLQLLQTLTSLPLEVGCRGHLATTCFRAALSVLSIH